MMKEFLDSLSKSAWETSCARYNSSRRLKIREIFSTISIALIGLSGIALSLMQSSFGETFGKNLNNLVAAFSIVLSMLLIIISLIEWGFAAGAKSEALFRNAELLNEHERKIILFGKKLTGDLSQEDYNKIDALREEYEKIKSTCGFNHSPIDYEFHKIIKKRFYISKTTEHFSFLRDLKGRLSYYLCSIWGYLLIWGLVVCFFYAVIKKVIALP
ncbi:SLATT domain-containing protein [Serratia quinivorans]|uniref:SLATT domain-containing protein n=1 Tax=Serratia quinivorans TaxID=137545 RepID=UPI003905940B